VRVEKNIKRHEWSENELLIQNDNEMDEAMPGQYQRYSLEKNKTKEKKQRKKDEILAFSESNFSRIMFDVADWDELIKLLKVIGSQIVNKTKLHYSFSKFDSFSLEWALQLLNWSGKTPVDEDRLMVLVMVGRRTWQHCFKKEVGIGSRSQLVSGE
jgi:Cft2 family RNA processing exonuclease